MKKILPLLIIVLFILSGLKVMAINNHLDNELYLESIDTKIQIAPITGKQTNEELKIYSTSYKQQLKNLGNYKEIIEQQKSIEITDTLQTYDYVIITAEYLNDAITSSMFLEWKEHIGYNVKIVNITDSEIASQAGDDLPEKIRNFLRSYYQYWGIEYVLIIGNHATIPMRYCYPDPTNHRFDIFDWTSGEVPTDYYYADLSSSDTESWI